MSSAVTVVSHPLVQHKLSLLRDRETSFTNFRRLVREIGTLLGYEATRDLPLAMREIETPVSPMRAPFIEGKKLCVVPILRAGLGLADGVVDLVPLARIGPVGLYRDPETLTAVEYYFKVPPDIDQRLVLVCDPMLATAHSAIAAVDRLKQAGAQHLKLLCVIAAPEGAALFVEAHPDVPVVVGAIDERLNEHAYIVPGLGDAGDRLFGTR
jgi:uracil phosphoribosyltransferase